MTDHIVIAAGIDIAKDKLDVAVHGKAARFTVENGRPGWRQLVGVLAEHGVTRVGLEATGGYERGVVEYLRAKGFTVLVLQPLQSLPRRRPGSRPMPGCICGGPRTTSSMRC